MLQPRASSPPSAKNRACTVSTEAMVRKAACGPKRIARIMPPPRWPLDPVPGMVEVDHLRGEDEGPQHAHERRPGALEPVAHDLGAVAHEPCRHSPHGPAHGGGDQRIRHMHRSTSACPEPASAAPFPGL